MEFEEAYNTLIDSVVVTKENKNQLFEALNFIKKDMKQRAELEILIHAFLKTGLKAVEEEAIEYGQFWLDMNEDSKNSNTYKFFQQAIKALEQEPCENCISRENALRVAKNEYLRGWHNALRKALSEKYSIHCEEGKFSVIQEETITGLGLSMDCALGKDVESYMSTMPSVTPQEPILDRIRAEIKALSPEPTAYDVVDGNPIKDAVWETIADVLKILDKYKESAVEDE